MTTPPFLRTHLGALSAVALVVTWSSGFVGAELGSRAHAAPLTLLGWRFLALAVLLVAVAALRRTPWPTWRAWRRQAVLGVLCQAGYLLLVFEGVSHGVPGGTAALVAAVQPLLVATVAGSLLGEHSTPRMWVGMLIGLVGVGVVVSGDLGVTDAPLWAYALPVAGMLCLASGTVLTRRLRPPESLLETLMMQSVVTAVLLMALALVFGQGTPPATLEFWRAVVWLLVLASLGGYVMYIHVARTQGATAVSTWLFLTPPTTMFWVFVMFGERVTVPGLVGLVVSGLGVWLALARRRPAPEPEPSPEAAFRRT
ncbi:MAG: EamA/RhaT family transporter [Marmoricola sp.]|jgi:drug/metabolite transporter (DMT)-like permease|nr:EamA/RhaT family transporter [Marmoricola sp.]